MQNVVIDWIELYSSVESEKDINDKTGFWFYKSKINPEMILIRKWNKGELLEEISIPKKSITHLTAYLIINK